MTKLKLNDLNFFKNNLTNVTKRTMKNYLKAINTKFQREIGNNPYEQLPLQVQFDSFVGENALHAIFDFNINNYRDKQDSAVNKTLKEIILDEFNIKHQYNLFYVYELSSKLVKKLNLFYQQYGKSLRLCPTDYIFKINRQNSDLIFKNRKSKYFLVSTINFNDLNNENLENIQRELSFNLFNNPDIDEKTIKFFNPTHGANIIKRNYEYQYDKKILPLFIKFANNELPNKYEEIEDYFLDKDKQQPDHSLPKFALTYFIKKDLTPVFYIQGYNSASPDIIFNNMINETKNTITQEKLPLISVLTSSFTDSKYERYSYKTSNGKKFKNMYQKAKNNHDLYEP